VNSTEGFPQKQSICGADVLGPATGTDRCAVGGARDDDRDDCARAEPSSGTMSEGGNGGGGGGGGGGETAPQSSD